MALSSLKTGKILKATITGRNFDTLRIGTFNLTSPGYQSVAIRGIEKSGSTFGDISDFLISGPVTEGRVWFIKDDFYFGRRGPSVHLRYDLSGVNGDIEWFYNEITVPEGNDVIGSYFMANGFAEITIRGKDGLSDQHGIFQKPEILNWIIEY